jgi:hypothetical protein
MIHAVGYDAKTKTLEVVFNSGRTYLYSEVPRSVYKGLMAADSKGSYMRACIIDCYPDSQLRNRKRY